MLSIVSVNSYAHSNVQTPARRNNAMLLYCTQKRPPLSIRQGTNIADVADVPICVHIVTLKNPVQTSTSNIPTPRSMQKSFRSITELDINHDTSLSRRHIQPLLLQALQEGLPNISVLARPLLLLLRRRRTTIFLLIVLFVP